MADIKLYEKIEQKAIQLGFCEMALSNLDDFNFYGNKLGDFIDKDYHGEMKWLKDKYELRKNPKNLWPSAKSALVFGINYGPEKNPLKQINNSNKAYISIYARRKDYHKVIKKKLKLIANYIGSISDMGIKVFVDTAPLMEKPLAEKADIGWMGKHTNLVSRNFGSWLFLGIILTDYEFNLAIKKKNKNNCGTCNACNEICPTKAFIKPFIMDARKCISYLTIEHKSHIDKDLRKKIGNRIFGCDDCLAVCPWNKFAKKYNEINFKFLEHLDLPSLEILIKFTEQEYRNYFAGTPVRRLGYDRFLRNVLIAAGNSNDTQLISLIIDRLDYDSEIVRVSAVWALYQLDKETFKKEKNIRLEKETNEHVLSEWNSIL